MDYDSNYFKVLLTYEELQLPAIDEFHTKFSEWMAISKESKTRAANRRADLLYEELMSFKMPPIEIKNVKTKSSPAPSIDTSVDSEDLSSSSRPITRSLRSRSRTPTTTPCTPTHQRIRTNMKQGASGNSHNNQVSASASKLRQQLRADSAQKKREEEKERNERLLLDRKVKENRAEAQKKQLLEERAINAKKKREQRLQHAAEVRKAREEQKQKQKQKLLEQQQREIQAENTPPVKPTPPQKTSKSQEPHNSHQIQQKTDAVPPPTDNHNETFNKPSEVVNNIDIVICDDSGVEQKEKVPVVAAWARAPHLREALIKQFTKPYSETLKKEVLGKIIKVAKLPVDLEQILGPNNAVGGRHMVRTSSAVWSPPNRPSKRSSSSVLTPNNDSIKR